MPTTQETMALKSPTKSRLLHPRKRNPTIRSRTITRTNDNVKGIVDSSRRLSRRTTERSHPRNDRAGRWSSYCLPRSRLSVIVMIHHHRQVQGVASGLKGFGEYFAAAPSGKGGLVDSDAIFWEGRSDQQASPTGFDCLGLLHSIYMVFRRVCFYFFGFFRCQYLFWPLLCISFCTI
jgi:hypothetical protein